MSAASLFRAGGDTYDLVSRTIHLLPLGRRLTAMLVLAFLQQRALAGSLDESVTDQAIADGTGLCERSVQYGLHALHRLLGELGQAIIDRAPSHGRRVITFVRGLAPSRDSKGQAPPSTPQSSNQQTSTDGTAGPSSSSFEPNGGKDGEDHASLIERAIGLVPSATPERVEVSIATYGADWVSRALDIVELRNRKPGNGPVRSWKFVLSTLQNWKREGGPPALPSAPAPAPVAPKAPEAPEDPVKPGAWAEFRAKLGLGPRPRHEAPAPAKRMETGMEIGVEPVGPEVPTGPDEA